MADVDAFGLRVGTKVSMAAALMARPQGTTMPEIVEATGDAGTKCNIMNQLEARGHKVRREREGRRKRYFLEHQDPSFIPEPIVPEVKEWPALPERRLQMAVRDNLDKLEPGLVAVDGGREEGGRDITAKDQAGNTVVIELWCGTAGEAKVAQLLRNMGKLKAAGVRGILLAHDFSANALAAASRVPDIELKRYSFHLGNLTFETP
jgi:hypothetical protein